MHDTKESINAQREARFESRGYFSENLCVLNQQRQLATARRLGWVFRVQTLNRRVEHRRSNFPFDNHVTRRLFRTDISEIDRKLVEPEWSSSITIGIGGGADGGGSGSGDGDGDGDSGGGGLPSQ
ncbi:hypothetical protein V1478_004770 [Vespula squamosa]|uniref:Uncharacterized protein n=1 Tax=Vespula squamosa TaxID=30214 RepID=A0ABD2BER9_VESSQ